MTGKQSDRKWIALMLQAINRQLPFIVEIFSHLAWKG